MSKLNICMIALFCFCFLFVLSDIHAVNFSYVGIMDDAILLNIFYTYVGNVLLGNGIGRPF